MAISFDEIQVRPRRTRKKDGKTAKEKKKERAATTETRNLVFGVHGQPTRTSEINHVFWLRNEFRNTLAQIECERRAKETGILQDLDTPDNTGTDEGPEVRLPALAAALDAICLESDQALAAIRQFKMEHNKRKSDNPAPEVPTELLQTRREKLWAIRSAEIALYRRKKIIRKIKSAEAPLRELGDWVASAHRHAYGNSQLSWHQYNDILASCKAFVKGPAPRKRKFISSDHHRMCIFVDGKTLEELTEGPITFTLVSSFDTPVKETRFPPNPYREHRFKKPRGPRTPPKAGSKRSRRRGQYRVSLVLTNIGEDKKKIRPKDQPRVEFDAVLHKRKEYGDQPIPPGAKISQVYLYRVRYGHKSVWSLMVTLSSKEKIKKSYVPAKSGRVGVDLGWRMLPHGLRVAYAVGSDKRHHELIVPLDQMGRWDHAEEVKKPLGDLFNKFKADMSPFAKAWRDDPDLALPAEVRWLADHLPWLREEWRLYRCLVAWRSERFEGDEEAFDIASRWLERWTHLKPWSRYKDVNNQRWRQNLYRNWVRTLRTDYAEVVIEDIDWREFAKTESKLTMSNKERENLERCRRIACVSQIKGSILEYFKGSVFGALPEYTTLRCHQCGHCDSDWDPKTKLSHRCSKCGAEWDQDANAANNLLACLRHNDVYALPLSDESREKRKEARKTGKAKARASRER